MSCVFVTLINSSSCFIDSSMQFGFSTVQFVHSVWLCVHLYTKLIGDTISSLIGARDAIFFRPYRWRRRKSWRRRTFSSPPHCIGDAFFRLHFGSGDAFNFTLPSRIGSVHASVTCLQRELVFHKFLLMLSVKLHDIQSCNMLVNNNFLWNINQCFDVEFKIDHSRLLGLVNGLGPQSFFLTTIYWHTYVPSLFTRVSLYHFSINSGMWVWYTVLTLQPDSNPQPTLYRLCCMIVTARSNICRFWSWSAAAVCCVIIGAHGAQQCFFIWPCLFATVETPTCLT